MRITFEIMRPPTPKARHRQRQVTTKAGQTFTQAYNDPKKQVEADALGYLLMEYRPPQPFEGALSLQVTCYLPIPKSYSKKKAAAAMTGELRPVKKPDIDNLVKQLMDIMRGTFYKDDCQVCHQVASKYYGDPARWVISLATLAE